MPYKAKGMPVRKKNNHLISRDYLSTAKKSGPAFLPRMGAYEKKLPGVGVAVGAAQALNT
jgi:hypothetical protein